MDLKEQALLGSAAEGHWYFVSKGRALRRMLRGVAVEELLDVGAGSGIFARQLLDAGVAARAVCVDPGYPREWTELHHGKPIAFVRSVPEVHQPLVLMMDVLEHVDDDAGLLRSYTEPMPAGGQVAITVPAFQWLWSGHDDFLEHRRRYTRASLERLVRAAGLEPAYLGYFFASLLWAAAAQRLGGRWLRAHRGTRPASALRPLPAVLNRAVTAVHDVERRLVFPTNRVAGLSVFCLARKSAPR